MSLFSYCTAHPDANVSLSWATSAAASDVVYFFIYIYYKILRLPIQDCRGVLITKSERIHLQTDPKAAFSYYIAPVLKVGAIFFISICMILHLSLLY